MAKSKKVAIYAKKVLVYMDLKTGERVEVEFDIRGKNKDERESAEGRATTEIFRLTCGPDKVGEYLISFGRERLN
jgi:hypothetical protein